MWQAAIFNDFSQYAYYSKQPFLLSAKRVVSFSSHLVNQD
jgi:hypothetical protein